jgi:hypothetical protein
MQSTQLPMTGGIIKRQGVETIGLHAGKHVHRAAPEVTVTAAAS